MSQADRTPRDGRALTIGPLAALPVFFELTGKRVLVAGDGAAAAWKAELLAAAGALVDVYGDDPVPELRELATRIERVRLAGRSWRESDLDSAALAVAHFADRAEAERFAAAARRAGSPANIVDRPELGDFQFGSILERSPIVIGVSTAGAAPVLAQAIRARLEAVLPQGLRDWASAAAAWRPSLQSKPIDVALKRRFWARFAALALADRGDPPGPDGLESMLKEVSDGQAAEQTGSVALVGAGPGDPDLLTLKAVRELQSADVVLFDDLVSPETVAMARREARKITVGKRGYKPSCTQEDISALIVALAREGKRVVRLKGGDPSIFGRANEEMDALARAGVRFEIVPGVTSASAAAASIGRSLTERDLARRVQFVTAHARNGRLPDDLDWRALVDPQATTAVYMGLQTLPVLVERLLREGLEATTPAALVENASLSRERSISCAIADLPEAVRKAELTGPCLVLIGRALGPPSLGREQAGNREERRKV